MAKSSQPAVTHRDFCVSETIPDIPIEKGLVLGLWEADPHI
jgi:hypothetical protein